MKTTEHILHIAKFNNNCPGCYTTDGLKISFVQEEIENKFHSKMQKIVAETLYCHACNNIIYPVNWNEDIDRVYQYHKKQAIPKSSRVRLQPITYGIILFCFGAVVALIYFLGNN